MNQKISPGTNKNKIGGTVFDLLDEAYFSLKENLADILALHLLACVPFLLGIMFFIFRFANYNSTDNDIIKWSLLLTVLFCWKNFIQCLLCGKMMDITARREHPKFSFKNTGMMFFKQTVIQSLGPLLIVFLIGAPWVAWMLVPAAIFMLPALFYTSAIVCAIEPELGFWDFVTKTASYISSNFIKLLGMMLVVIIGTIILCINVTIIILTIPFLLKMFWGIDTQFTLALSTDLFFNTTLWSIILALVYLFVDPFCRLLYVLRVFYSESIGKGWDIQSTLHSISSKAAKSVLIFLLLFSTILLKADTADTKAPLPQKKTEVTSKQLENHINETLKQLEFQWRQPKTAPEEESWIAKYLKLAFKYLGEVIDSIFNFLRDFFKKNVPSDSSEKLSGFKLFLMNTWEVLKYLLPSLLIILIAIIIVRRARKHRKDNNVLTSIARRPDLTKENVVADELEEHEWLKLGRELLDNGEFRLALRAFYLACISALAQRKLLLVRPYKTDYEYLRELRRRAHVLPEIISVFENNVSIFQQIWYGDYPVNRELLDKYVKNSKVLFSEKKSNSGKPKLNEE